jgi:maleylacetoacetate isomerase
MSALRLYTYYRSSAAHRVRIALALKNLAYESLPVHLVNNGGEHRRPEYCAINPQGRVPTLVTGAGDAIVQSLAILEYLEEIAPEPPLLPGDAVMRSKIRGVAALIGCDVHPLNNISVLTRLREDFHASEEQVTNWITTWVHAGFKATEKLIGETHFSFGQQPTLADVVLVPQIFSARRFQVKLDNYPRILRVEAEAARHPAFIDAAPQNQPDALYQNAHLHHNETSARGNPQYGLT